MSIERHGEDVVVTPPPAVFNLREELPRIVSDLSTEELRELVRNLREGFLGKLPIGASAGAELARLIEPTAPGLAKQVRPLKTPEEVMAWIQLWLAVLEVVLGLMAPNQIVININIDNDQTTINIEHNETTTIVNPPPPPVPPTPPPPAPPTGEAPSG